MPARSTPWCMILAVLMVIGAVIGGAPVAASAGREPDIFFVPTPQYVVNEMLEIAHTTKDDIVYDLGCGDGRFVITAAKRYGARGVGIDIDPERVRESETNAKKAGVADRVTFLEADLFKTDIRQATVVALYLTRELNLQLRPKLFKELKPGTRIVSHYFDMTDWKPDVREKLGTSEYFLWILPADVSGTWNVKLPLPGGARQDYTVHIMQKFQALAGQATSEGMAMEISNLEIRGNALSFFLSRRIKQWKTDMYFKGTIVGDSLSGTAQIEGGPFEGLHTWTAVRTK